MSCIIALPILIPAAQVALPIVASAIGTAAGVLGYSAVKAKTKINVQTGVEVEIEASQAEALVGQVAAGESLVFQREDITLTVVRGRTGKLTVKAHSDIRGKAELEEVAQEFCNRVAQQYAYHTLLEELQTRDFTVVDQQVEEDGTVRVKVRTYQG